MMKCPKCAQTMERVTQKGVTVDRCRGCSGIWFDAMEAEDLIDLDLSAEVDTGKSVVGWKMNFVRDISCPKCGRQMQTVSDNTESLVTFEVCTNCHGYFMDAGEFRDIAHTNSPERLTEAIVEKGKQYITIFKSMHLRDDEPRQ